MNRDGNSWSDFQAARTRFRALLAEQAQVARLEASLAAPSYDPPGRETRRLTAEDNEASAGSDDTQLFGDLPLS